MSAAEFFRAQEDVRHGLVDDGYGERIAEQMARATRDGQSLNAALCDHDLLDEADTIMTLALREYQAACRDLSPPPDDASPYVRAMYPLMTRLRRCISLDVSEQMDAEDRLLRSE